jgi:hypothetical protein
MILLILILGSCKNATPIDELEVEKTQVVDDPFKVVLKVVSENDDDVALYYTTDGTTDFKLDAIWQGIQGNSAEQEVVFSLPAGVKPTQVRFDFAFKDKQEKLTIKQVAFINNGNTRTISGDELGAFFRADVTKCTFNPSSGVVEPVIKNGKKEMPSIYPHEAVLRPELEKLAK